MLPKGGRGKVWLAHEFTLGMSDSSRALKVNRSRPKKIGDDRHWRLNVPEAARIDQEARDADRRRATNADIAETELQPTRPPGFRVRLCIEAERELQILGCGWRVVTVQLDGPNVHIHHAGYTATMKRNAFKEFLARNRAARPRKPLKPTLRLVVSNPPPARAKAA